MRQKNQPEAMDADRSGNRIQCTHCLSRALYTLAAFNAFVYVAEQQVAVAVEAENIQAKWPEPAAQTAHLLSQSVPQAASQSHVSLYPEQARKRDGLSSTLQEGHEEIVLARRAGHNRAIDEQQVLCIAVLHLVPLQLGSFYLLERRYFWHSCISFLCR